MIRAIIFDFDGVLVESVEIKSAAFARLFASEGPEIVREVVAYHRAHGGLPREEKLRYYYRQLLRRELSDSTLADLCDQFQQLVLGEVVRAPLVPGAQEALEMCQRSGYLAFVASGTPEEELREIIAQRGMTEYFAGVYGTPARKADIIAAILSRHALRAPEVAVVGDAHSDYDAAAAAGVHFVARRAPDNPLPWHDLGVTAIDDLRGLPQAIARLPGRPAPSARPTHPEGRSSQA